jgi:outer membrane protein assembly factor BamA
MSRVSKYIISNMKILLINIFIVFLSVVLMTDFAISQEHNDSIKTKVKSDTANSKTVFVKPTRGNIESLDTATFNVNEIKVIGYPYVFYTPETQLAFGLGGMVYFRTALQPAQKPSKITIAGYYTTNNQYLISLKPRIYFPGKKRTYLESDFYFSYDVGKFYGLGNSTKEIDSVNYKTSSFGIYVEAQRKGLVFDLLQVGLIYDYINVGMNDKMNNPNLYDSSVTGIDGGKVGGLGLSWTYDSRDNISFPSSGVLYKVSGIFYGRFFASDFTYNRYRFDLRQYVAPIKDNILAFQIYSDLNTGSPPFFCMPALGGSTRMRGFFEGRYRDKNYLMGQLEYRKIVWWRIGVAAFYSVGDVFGNFNQLKLSELKQSYGFGLRFVFDTKEKINLRVDFGKTKESTGIYFSMDEAF